MTLQNPNVTVHEMKGTEGCKDSGRSPRVEGEVRGQREERLEGEDPQNPNVLSFISLYCFNISFSVTVCVREFLGDIMNCVCTVDDIVTTRKIHESTK